MTTTPHLWKSATQANTTSALTQVEGHIAAQADGGYVVVWQDDSLTYNASGLAIVGQRYDAAGNKLGGEAAISRFGLGDQSSPAITHLPNGNVAVAFVETISGNPDIYVRVFDSSLDPVRLETFDAGANLTFDPSVTAFGGGDYLVRYP